MVFNNGPKYYTVSNIIDKNIKDKLKELSLLDAIDDLENRVIRFKSIIEKDFPGIVPEVVLESNLDNIDILELDDSFKSSRLRYNLYYILHSRKRAKDFKWMIRNRHKFYKYDNSQLFNLILLKEKLSKENALPF